MNDEYKIYSKIPFKLLCFIDLSLKNFINSLKALCLARIFSTNFAAARQSRAVQRHEIFRFISFLLALAVHLLIFFSWNSLLEKPQNSLAKGLSGLAQMFHPDPHSRFQSSFLALSHKVLELPRYDQHEILKLEVMLMEPPQEKQELSPKIKTLVNRKKVAIAPQKGVCSSTLLAPQHNYSDHQPKNASSAASGALEATPSYLHNPQPLYPEEERERGHEGTVLIRANINEQGTITHLVIEHSSGYPGLDHQAVETLERSWVFRPACLNGQPISSKALIPIHFSLKELYAPQE